MNDIVSLLKRAEKYLASAEVLIKTTDYESAVSRTYYAMFFAVEALFLAKGQSYASHKGVISAFGREYIKTGELPKEMGRELKRAYEKRQLSDYQHTFVITEEEAKELLEKAKTFVKDIEKYIQQSKKKNN